MNEIPGVTKEHPLYFRIIAADNIDWRKIILMLGITAISGYLATQSQRVGSNPDFVRTIKLRGLRKVSDISWKISNGTKRIAAEMDSRYLKVTL